ncbi:hypothetical protein [Neolewinella agarilytica]|uniref:hypothetical protein n=1 Tax=Neolewinella agarilytica TaxID=478744 RepID=UPI002353839F|nr:hypothetical protein [Neolewinella agarilytica]
MLLLCVGCDDIPRTGGQVNGPEPVLVGPAFTEFNSNGPEAGPLSISDNSRLHSYHAMLDHPDDFAWAVNEDGPAFVTTIEHDTEVSLHQRGYRLFLGRSRVQGAPADAEPDLLTAIVFEWTDRWELRMAANFSPPDYYVVEELLKPPVKGDRQVLFGSLSRRRTGNGYRRQVDVFLFNGTQLRMALMEFGDARKSKPLLEGEGELPPIYEVANEYEHYLIIDGDSTKILRHLNMGFYEAKADELSRESSILRDYLNDVRKERWALMMTGYGEEIFGYNGSGSISRDSMLKIDRAFGDSLQVLHLRSGNEQRSGSQQGYTQRSGLVYSIGRQKESGRLTAGIWDIGLTVDSNSKIREIRRRLIKPLPVDPFFAGVE